MSPLLRFIARYAAQKAASDPAVREKAIRATRGIAEEARTIAGHDDRAYAAGKAFRRAFDRLRSGSG